MSKSTLAIIAAASAGAGAAVTAAMYSLRSQSERKLDTRTISTTTTTVSTNATSAPIPIPSKQIFAPPNQQQHVLSTSAPAALGGSLAPVDPAGLFEYGFPGPVADIATRQALISSFDRRLRNPHWVIEHITPASLALHGGDRKHSVFLEDDGVPDKFRAKLKDYFRSGYDRGHQVPAADAKWSQTAMDETFYLTNMAPQVGEGFNRDYWAHFEDFCRRLTQRYPSVRIVTGPLYLPKRDPADNKWYVKYEMIGNPPNVAVPTHFYKVIFAEEDAAPGTSTGKVAIGAFLLPNARIPNEKPLTDFEVPIEAIERASGLEFASKLPPQRRKRLCTDTSCALIIKDYANQQKAFKSSSTGPNAGALVKGSGGR
ncbi:hypothetical protein GGR51DRAFT_497550 [Nemania sp. FL0031]|nr:hypothetical protein GGR51DRAFT_497550 [Nemania sp. FL0031]